jgi:hypothetical protein
MLPSKLQIGLFSLLLIITLYISLKNHGQFHIGTVIDDADYIVLARSMAFSDIYGFINVPGQPLHSRFPFGFPLMLSPIVRFFPDNIDNAKVLSLVATLLNTILLFFGWPYLSRNKSYWWGLIIAALFSTSPLVIGLSRMVVAEPIFTTLVLTALVLTGFYLLDSKQRSGILFIIGAIATLAVFTRTLGIALWIGIITCMIIQQRPHFSLKPYLYLLSGGIVFVLCVILLTPVSFRDLIPAEYIDQFNNPHAWGQSQIETPIIPRFFSALTEYARQHLREAVLPIGGGEREREFGNHFGINDLPLLIGTIIGCLILVGIFTFQTDIRVLPTVFVFEFLYLLMILLWPWRGVRFLYPILPLIYLQLLIGITLITNIIQKIPILTRFTKKQADNVFFGLVVLGLLLISVFEATTDNRTSLDYTRDFRVGTAWIKNNSSADSLVMAQQPRSIYLYAERNTIDYPKVSNLDEFEKVVLEQGVDIILIAPKLDWIIGSQLTYDEYTSEIIIPIINSLTEKSLLELVYESEEDLVYVYHVLH